MALFQKAETWSILDENGRTALDFDAFVDLDVVAQGEATTYPVESGSFATYDKVQSPLEITVTLSKGGTRDEFQTILSTLDGYKTGAVKLSVVTPSKLYESMTLESYSYKRAYQDGSGVLTVKLDLIEVREVETKTTTVSTATTTITGAKNASSESKSETGKTQTQTTDQSKLYGRFGSIWS